MGLLSGLGAEWYWYEVPSSVIGLVLHGGFVHGRLLSYDIYLTPLLLRQPPHILRRQRLHPLPTLRIPLFLLILQPPLEEKLRLLALKLLRRNPL